MRKILKIYKTPEQERIAKVQAVAFHRFAAIWKKEEVVIRHIWHEIEHQEFHDARAIKALAKIKIKISERQMRYFRRKVIFMVKMDSWMKSGKRPKNWSGIMRRET